ncbi:MAG: CysS/YqeB C-terminal domain-containing protein [Anaerolineae bacterium]
MHIAGHAPGRIALLGSGETSLAGGRVFESLAKVLPTPLRVAVLETPAGFELNSDRVAGRVADFLAVRLQNYRPQVAVIPARRKGARFSPDDPEITAPLLHADLIFMGPGSPTYAVRQLADSLAWWRMIARQRIGATLALASAAVVAISAYALPVYEIYKAGHDLHWQPGLDLFGPYGLKLVFVPHWNNAEGGAELDTSRCFMGESRFEVLRAMLPPDATVVGIDEHTALAIDLADGTAQVMGAGDVTVLQAGHGRRLPAGERFSLAGLGPFAWPRPDAGLPPEVWAEALAAHEMDELGASPPDEVLALVAEREAARRRRDWAAADALRARIAALGWQVRDTPDGPTVVPG